MPRVGTRGKPAEVPMSAMIDVVFLLLVYFILTFKPQTVEANMAVNLPSPDTKTRDQPPPQVLEVWVMPQNQFLMGGRRGVSVSELQGILIDAASYRPDQTLIIKVHPEAIERQLIEVLDACRAAGLTNLNVMTLKQGTAG